MTKDFEDALDEAARVHTDAHIDGPAYLAEYHQAGRKGVRQALLVEYRCVNTRACLLLQAWMANGRVLYYRPAYKRSRNRNENESVPQARQRNTLDGDRHWKPRAGNLSALAGWSGVGIDLNCDHSEVIVTPRLVLADADAATPGTPKRRLVAGRNRHALLDCW